MPIVTAGADIHSVLEEVNTTSPIAFIPPPETETYLERPYYTYLVVSDCANPDLRSHYKNSGVQPSCLGNLPL